MTTEASIADIQAVSKHVTKFTVNDIYLMMGRELELIEEVPCGNIVAIGGLENLILKSATLSSTLYCPSFTSMYMQTSPIVRVAIEPKNPGKFQSVPAVLVCKITVNLSICPLTSQAERADERLEVAESIGSLCRDHGSGEWRAHSLHSR